MLYNEFVENTKCKETEYNYSVYKALEALYMANDSITKETIYKAGKLLIDNSETPAEKAAREERDRMIREWEEYIADQEEQRKSYQHRVIDETDPAWKKYLKDNIKEKAENIRQAKAKIKLLKAC